MRQRVAAYCPVEFALGKRPRAAIQVMDNIDSRPRGVIYASCAWYFIGPTSNVEEALTASLSGRSHYNWGSVRINYRLARTL